MPRKPPEGYVKVGHFTIEGKSEPARLHKQATLIESHLGPVRQTYILVRIEEEGIGIYVNPSNAFEKMIFPVLEEYVKKSKGTRTEMRFTNVPYELTLTTDEAAERISALDSQKKRLEERLEIAEEETDRLNDRFVKILKDYGTAKEELQKTKDAYQEQKARLQEAKTRVEELQEAYGSLEGQHQDLTQNLENLTTRYQELEQAKINFWDLFKKRPKKK